MGTNKIISDIICQVLVEKKSKDVIYAVLNEFIPGYETINLNYTGKPYDDNYTFSSEDEMINCYIEAPNVEQQFYWNKAADNPNEIMVGANITNDNHLVMSLTFNGTSETEASYYLRLKQFLNAKVGVITYVIPAEYEDGKDFRKRYEKEKYDFEL